MFQFLFFSFLVELGFELGFTLAKQALYHLSHTFSPFCSGYFGMGSCKLFAQAGLELQSSSSQPLK
jgi:hypothetical protein